MLPLWHGDLQSLAVTESLLAASLVLDGHLVIRDDGDDLVLEERRQTQSHAVDLWGKYYLKITPST